MSDMLNEWIKQTHGSYDKMIEGEERFLEKEKKEQEAKQKYINDINARKNISLSEHLGYKSLDLKPCKDGQVSYFKNYDFDREKTLRSFKRDDGVEMGDLGSGDVE